MVTSMLMKKKKSMKKKNILFESDLKLDVSSVALSVPTLSGFHLSGE